MPRRLFRVLLVTFVLLLVAAGIGVLWARGQLRGSLAQLEGTRRLPGLSAQVQVTRDALGIPTIRGATRVDVARATGFLHAQDRYFQMDLARRRAAGELSALVGPRALALDREIRIHRFRAEAQRALRLMDADDRALLEAYTAGVNEGLSALESPPFEYLVLRQDPASWRAEDSFLVVLSMFVTLQDTDGSYESTLATMAAVLPPAMYQLMAPRGSEWDAPIDGSAFAAPLAIPPASVYDLRSRRAGKPPGIPRPNIDRVELGEPEAAAVGSNSFAVSGRLTADGGALLANDMHLSVRVPNIWYRAALEWSDASADGEPHRLIGVTLPGSPAVVVGSNTYVAWGFTNTYADWGDIVVLDVDPAHPDRYRTPHGWREFERYDEVIEIAVQEARHEPVSWTIWGPVLGPDHRGRLRAYKWVAHSAERLATAATPFETARSIEEVFETANGLGTPGQNIVAADRNGRIGWSIYGSIPRRVGLDGSVPTSWADGTRGWDGWLSTPEYPRLLDPAGDRIWTANARVVDGEMLAKLGDGSYEVGSRATIIRDRLLAQERFTPEDMLKIQLDTRAVFLARWRELILKTLTSDLVAGKRERALFRDIVERDWDGQASPQSAGYRLTRMFREQVSERVIAFVLAECYESDRSFDHTTLRRREGPIWKLVTEKPMHLLDPQFSSWEELLAAATDTVLERVARDGDLKARVWSEYNVTAYRHPLSA